MLYVLGSRAASSSDNGLTCPMAAGMLERQPYGYTVAENAQSGSEPAAQHGVPAERLDRSDFGSQMQKKALLIEQHDTFQPPAERHTVLRINRRL
jgi:hypothetical protein